jgi:hypothetical protein
MIESRGAEGHDANYYPFFMNILSLFYDVDDDNAF